MKDSLKGESQKLGVENVEENQAGIIEVKKSPWAKLREMGRKVVGLKSEIGSAQEKVIAKAEARVSALGGDSKTRGDLKREVNPVRQEMGRVADSGAERVKAAISGNDKLKSGGTGMKYEEWLGSAKRVEPISKASPKQYSHA